MLGSIDIESSVRDQVVYLRIAGRVDEHLDGDALLAACVQPTVIIDLGDIESVESSGHKKWKAALQELCAKADRLIVVECAPAIVGALNSDAKFLATGEVVSVRAPYRCETCMIDIEVSIDADHAATSSVPATACETCGSEIVINEDATAYFEFTSSVPPASVDEPMRRLIDELTGATAGLPPMAPGPTEMATESTKPSSAGTAARLDPTLNVEAVTDDGFGHDDESEGYHTDIDATEHIDAYEPRPSLGRSGKSKSRRHTESHVRDVDSLDGPSPLDRIREIVATLRERQGSRMWIAGGAVLMFLAGWIAAPGGVDTGALLEFRQHVAATRVQEARASLRDLKGALPEELFDLYDAEIKSQSASTAGRLAGQAQELYGDGKYGKAAKRATKALERGVLDADVVFVAGDSYRQLRKLDKAAEYFSLFIKHFADDSRYDDALFWMGEIEVKRGNVGEARTLFARVIAAPNSNFRRSATRRLSELEAK